MKSVSEGYEHTSGNQVTSRSIYMSIQILFSKSTKAWIKRSLRVITWLGYKRKVISGTIEIKWPTIREHSIYFAFNR